MTDPYKYRSISLRNKTYSKLEDLTNIVVPGSTLSNAKTVEILIDEKHRNSQGTFQRVQFPDRAYPQNLAAGTACGRGGDCFL